MNIFLSGVLIAVSAFLTQLFSILAANTRLLDKPNARSLHTKPTIRGGGLVFIGLALCSMPVLCYYSKALYFQLAVFFSAILLVAVVSFMDDLYTLSARVRFSVQTLAAVLIILFMKPETLDLGLFSMSTPFLVGAFLLFVILGAINHFNFMDGMDGFCTLQAVFLLAAYSVLLGESGALPYVLFCQMLICFLLGFLLFNFPPAKLFMGDVGSATLGLIIVVIAIIAQQQYHIPMVYWFLLNGLFLFDASITLLRRVARHEQWFAAHRKHAYQRLKRYGVHARVILLGQCIINLGLFGFVLYLHHKKADSVFLLLTPLLILVPLYFYIERLSPMFQDEKCS